MPNRAQDGSDTLANRFLRSNCNNLAHAMAFTLIILGVEMALFSLFILFYGGIDAYYSLQTRNAVLKGDYIGQSSELITLNLTQKYKYIVIL